MVARCSESNDVCLLIRTLVDIPNVLIFNGALRYDVGFATIGGYGKQKRLTRCISTLLFGLLSAHTVMRVRVQIGHTVSRASSLPKIIADPHPVSCLRPPKSIANIIRRFFCLYHDLLGGAFITRAFVSRKMFRNFYSYSPTTLKPFKFRARTQCYS